MGVEIRGQYKTIGGFSAATPIPPPTLPEWITVSGLIASGGEGTTLNAQVLAQDNSGTGLTYSFVGTPPGSVLLNPTTGVLSGTFPGAYGTVGSTRDYTITIIATDGNGNQTVPRDFTLRSSYNVPATMPASFRFTDSLFDASGNSYFTVSGGGQATVGATTGPQGQESTALVMTNSTYLTNPNIGTTYSFLTGQSTIEFWFKVPNPFVTGNKRVIDIGANTLGFLRLDGNSSGGNDFKYHFILGGPTTTGGVEPVAGQWMHFALTHNGSGQWIQYNNGIAGSPLTRSVPATYFNNLRMSINTYDNSTTYAYPTAVLRGLCFHNRRKYTSNFTPDWDNFLN